VVRYYEIEYDNLTKQLSYKENTERESIAEKLGGEILKIRREANAEPPHLEIYKNLGIPSQVVRPIKTWHTKI